MAQAMDALTEALGGVPAIPNWVHRPPENRLGEWMPRPGGMLAGEQRRLRRYLEGSGNDVPMEWKQVEGQGCPGWWMRLAEGTAVDPDAWLGVNQEADAAAEEARGATSTSCWMAKCGRKLGRSWR